VLSVGLVVDGTISSDDFDIFCAAGALLNGGLRDTNGSSNSLS